jgi:hypothetical protein
MSGAARPTARVALPRNIRRSERVCWTAISDLYLNRKLSKMKSEMFWVLCGRVTISRSIPCNPCRHPSSSVHSKLNAMYRKHSGIPGKPGKRRCAQDCVIAAQREYSHGRTAFLLTIMKLEMFM